MEYYIYWLSIITGLDQWTGLVNWTGGLTKIVHKLVIIPIIISLYSTDPVPNDFRKLSTRILAVRLGARARQDQYDTIVITSGRGGGTL